MLGYRYNNSPIIIPDGSEETLDNPRKYIPTARPGHRAPHLWLEEGVSIYDKFGKNFTLLSFVKKDSDIKKFLEVANKINIPIKFLKIDNKNAHNLYNSLYVLVRPDLMIAWRSNNMPSNPLDVLETIRGER